MSIVTVVVTPKFTALMAPSNQIAAVIFCGEKRCAGYVLSRMKYLLMLTVLAAAICFSGCASSDTATAKGDPVPGEKTGDESRLQPGAGSGPNASVKW